MAFNLAGGDRIRVASSASFVSGTAGRSTPALLGFPRHSQSTTAGRELGGNLSDGVNTLKLTPEFTPVLSRRERLIVAVLSNPLALVIFEAFDRVAQLVEQRTFNP